MKDIVCDYVFTGVVSFLFGIATFYINDKAIRLIFSKDESFIFGAILLILPILLFVVLAVIKWRLSDLERRKPSYFVPQLLLCILCTYLPYRLFLK